MSRARNERRRRQREVCPSRNLSDDPPLTPAAPSRREIRGGYGGEVVTPMARSCAGCGRVVRLLLPFSLFFELGALALKVRVESFDLGGPPFMLRPFSLAEPLPVLGGSVVAAGGDFVCPRAVPVPHRGVGGHGPRAYRQGQGEALGS